MAQSMSTIENKGEKISLSTIGGGYEIFVSKDHTFGTDAVLLANFAGVKTTDNAIDLGTGCGIIPFLWKRDNKNIRAVGFEISKNAIELANATKEKYNFKELDFVEGDIKNPFAKLNKAQYTLVTCNPPYKAEGAGIISESTADQAARHETLCSLEDVISASAGLLKFGGRLALCHRPERLGEIFSLMTKYKIEPKKLRLVCKSVGKEPWLVLVEGRLGGGKGLRILPNLYVYSKSGSMSDEMIKIYGPYANENKITGKEKTVF